MKMDLYNNEIEVRVKMPIGKNSFEELELEDQKTLMQSIYFNDTTGEIKNGFNLTVGESNLLNTIEKSVLKKYLTKGYNYFILENHILRGYSRGIDKGEKIPYNFLEMAKMMIYIYDKFRGNLKNVDGKYEFISDKLKLVWYKDGSEMYLKLDLTETFDELDYKINIVNVDGFNEESIKNFVSNKLLLNVDSFNADTNIEVVSDRIVKMVDTVCSEMNLNTDNRRKLLELVNLKFKYEIDNINTVEDINLIISESIED